MKKFKKLKYIFYDVIISGFFSIFNFSEKTLIFVYKSKNFDKKKFSLYLSEKYQMDYQILSDFFYEDLSNYDLLKNVQKVLTGKLLSSIKEGKCILTYFIPKYSLMKKICNFATEHGYKIYLLTDTNIKVDDKISKLNIQIIKI